MAGDQPLRVMAVTRKPEAASFEQRVAGYVPLLAERGIDVTVRVLPTTWRGERRVLRELASYDAVWWQRHLLQPWSLPMLRRAGRPVVFDFDDPLPMSATGPSLSRRIKFAAMLRCCDLALAASEHLASLARPHCRRVEVLPMPVDLPAPVSPRPGGGCTLLWLGSRATQPYLELIRPALEQLGRDRPGVVLRLVAHEAMTFAPLTVDYRPWSPAEQSAALSACDVSLCPMPDTPWTRGKCPYKVLQAMSVSMPWIGSAVGENRRVAGGLAVEPGDWGAALRRLADDPAERARLGAAGRAYAAAHHDRRVLAERLAGTFRGLAGRSAR